MEPYSRTWNLEATCFERSSSSLNVTVSSPDPVLYAADVNAGFEVSRTSMVCFAPANGLPAASLTAPSSIWSSGWPIAFTAVLSAASRVNAR